jgi:hypothetical protein
MGGTSKETAGDSGEVWAAFHAADEYKELLKARAVEFIVSAQVIGDEYHSEKPTVPVTEGELGVIEDLRAEYLSKLSEAERAQAFVEAINALHDDHPGKYLL